MIKYIGLLIAFVFANANEFIIHKERIFKDYILSYIIRFDYENNTVGFRIIDRLADDKVLLHGDLGLNINARDFLSDLDGCFTSNDTSICTYDESGKNILEWRTNNTSIPLKDCFILDEDVNWYGGPERYALQWPIEKSVIKESPYVPNADDSGGVKEAYWLNSLGGFIHVESQVPLFIEQNYEKNNSLCFTAKAETPYAKRNELVLKYYIEARPDVKESHLLAIEHALPKAKARPNDKMIREPIWTTWAKYKQDINDDVVVEFAKNISQKGYKGQIEIDDKWEACYGELEFDSDKFSNINETVKTLKDLGFRITLWVHPFVNDECEETTSFGRTNEFFYKDINGSDKAQWWNGDNAHHIDFTKTKSAEWFVNKLKTLKSKHGIDSFKFDAGEINYAPQNSILNASIEEGPGIMTQSYINAVAEFGDLIEVRSSWKNQELGVFVRMEDKDSVWGIDNGLQSVITTLLQFNMIGYSMVLPDMIGGNGYGDKPTAELLVRWAQANTFMPAMQFSYLPWEITSDKFDVEKLVNNSINLHAEYADKIIEAMENHIEDGSPVNPPIWWVDPTNIDALKVGDEYLLGESILVAPVVVEGQTSRDVVLPAGIWKDGNSCTIYNGSITIKDYPAPIEVLPWFIKVE